MKKQEIRATIKDQKSELSRSQVRRHSDLIQSQLFQHPFYTSCSQLFCYVSFNQEVITTDIITMALSQGKKVAVPKIVGDEMKFFFIESFDELEPGVLGIMEPITEKEAIPVDTEQNLVIVPGIAFDTSRNRIGYGKGYYDRFFTKQIGNKMHKIALAYNFQILEQLPVDDYDVKVDQIITESGIIQ